MLRKLFTAIFLICPALAFGQTAMPTDYQGVLIALGQPVQTSALAEHLADHAPQTELSLLKWRAVSE